MERTRECGLIWWREGLHGWAIRGVGKLVRGPMGGIWVMWGVGVDIFMTVPLVRINYVASWLGTRARLAADIFSG